jgi:putative MATE family efflux protein
MDDLFLKAPVPKAYFKLALPVVLGMVASMIYNLADTFFIAKTQNANLVAGVTICTPLFSLMLALGDIFGLGGSALISRLLGQQKHNAARQASSFCFYAALLVGAIVSLLMLLNENFILRLLRTTGATYQYAAEFYRVMVAGSVLIIVSLIPGNLLRTEGLALESMIGTMVGTILTIILDPIFIFKLQLGATGAALATVIGYAFSDLVLVYYVCYRAKFLTIKPIGLKVNRATFSSILVIGIPASITNLMQSFGTALLNNALANYGAAAIAALGIALKVYLIVMLVMVGFAFGAQPLLGYNYGAKQMHRLESVIRFDLLIEVVAAFSLSLVLIAVAPAIVGCFMQNAIVIRDGAQILRCLLLTTPFVGAILVFTTLFQSAGQALGAFSMSISRQGVLLLMVLLVAVPIWGYLAIIWAQPAADVGTFLIGGLFYRRFKQKNKKIITKKPG